MKLHKNEVSINLNVLFFIVATFSRFVHWDVNNEMLNGPWYEENTNDPDCMADMFKEVRAKDPVGELFINEYGLVTYSSSAQVRG